MGKLSLSLFALGVAACGSDNNGKADAGKTFMDAPPKVFMDAPPKVFNDAPPVNYDFTCFGVTPPTTAPDPLVVSGMSETLTGQMPTAVKSHIQIFNGTTSVYSMDTADDGTFTANVTSNAMPVTGYIVASDIAATPTYRTSYMYPPGPMAANTTLPVPMVTQSLIDQLSALVTQDDTTNGFLVIPITDCSATQTPVDGATLSVKQGGNEVGQQIDIGQFVTQLAGVWLVANVPDGDVTVSATYGTMTFPSHLATAHKKPATANAMGTVTVTSVRPGP